jgi:hypothetical protein
MPRPARISNGWKLGLYLVQSTWNRRGRRYGGETSKERQPDYEIWWGLAMVLENGTPGKDVIDEGRVRLSLTDVIYGIVIGCGFNILAAEDPSGVKPLLFALVVWIIVSDWAFVHMMYWREHEKYTFWPFTIDLAILLNFAVMTRFALKPDHSYLPLAAARLAKQDAKSVWNRLSRKSKMTAPPKGGQGFVDRQDNGGNSGEQHGGNDSTGSGSGLESPIGDQETPRL